MRQLQKAYMTISNRPDVHDTVRVIMSRLGSFMEKEKRFKNFSNVQIASALLNPDKLSWDQPLIHNLSQQYNHCSAGLKSIEDIDT